jgi:hypothetical protein
MNENPNKHQEKTIAKEAAKKAYRGLYKLYSPFWQPKFFLMKKNFRTV